MATRHRIGLVFADSLTREGRRLLLQSQPEFDVVYEESDGLRVLETLPDASVDVVLVDTRIRSLGGVETIAKYLRRNSASGERQPAFVLTGPFAYDELTLAAVRGGATGVVSEEDTAETLLEVLKAAAKLDPSFPLLDHVRFFADQKVPHGGNQRWKLRLVDLNSDEESVLEAISNGADGSELKDLTGLPATKVRWTLDAIQARLGLSTRSQLALALYEAGITKSVG